MPEFTEHAPGTFCWPELVTSDADGAKQFYCDLFGWSFHDDHVGEDAVYSMLLKEDRYVGAFYMRNQGQVKAGVPPHWGQYVSVADVEASAGKATELGGKVLMGPMDVHDLGRMAVLQDPTGAVFSIWQTLKSYGAQLLHEPGSMCWNELNTNDTDRAGSFYAGLFGWEPSTQDMGGTLYTVFMRDGCPAGGMMAIQKEWGAVPPNWLPYFAVEDCDRTCEKASSIGGVTLVPPTDIPRTGRFGIVKDPQGAVFGVIRMESMD